LENASWSWSRENATWRTGPGAARTWCHENSNSVEMDAVEMDAVEMDVLEMDALAGGGATRTWRMLAGDGATRMLAGATRTLENVSRRWSHETGTWSHENLEPRECPCPRT